MPTLVGTVDNPYDDFALEDGQRIKLFQESELIWERNLPFVGPESPTGALYRMQQLQEARGAFIYQDILDESYEPFEEGERRRQQFERENPVITEEQFKKEYGDLGLTYTPGMRTKEAALLAEWKKEENEYKKKLELSESQPIGSFVAGFAAQAMDPINLALSIPTIGAGSVASTVGAKALTKVGATALAKKVTEVAARKTVGKAALAGAAENLIFNLPAEAMVAQSMKETQADEELYSFWENMLFAGGLGAGIGALGAGVRGLGRARRLEGIRAERAESLAGRQEMAIADTYRAYNDMMNTGTIHSPAGPLRTAAERQAYIDRVFPGEAARPGLTREAYVIDSKGEAISRDTWFRRMQDAEDAYKDQLDEVFAIKDPAVRADAARKMLDNKIYDELFSPEGRQEFINTVMGSENILDFRKDWTTMYANLSAEVRRRGLLRAADFETPQQAKERAAKGMVPFGEELEYKSQDLTTQTNEAEMEFARRRDVASGREEGQPMKYPPETTKILAAMEAEAAKIPTIEEVKSTGDDAIAAMEKVYQEGKQPDTPSLIDMPEYNRLKQIREDMPRAYEELYVCFTGRKGKGRQYDAGCLDRAVKKWMNKYSKEEVMDIVDAIDRAVEQGDKEALINVNVDARFQYILSNALEANEFALRSTIRSAAKLDEAWGRMRTMVSSVEGKERSWGEALGALLVGDYFGATGVRNSVDARRRALSDQFHGALFNEMKKHEVWREFTRGGEAFERAWSKELWDLEAKSGPEMFVPDRRNRQKINTDDTKEVKVAKIIYNIQDEAVRRQIMQGAYIKPGNHYIIKQNHNADKIGGRSNFRRALDGLRRTLGDENIPKDLRRSQHVAARTKWIDDMMEYLDLSRTFPNLWPEKKVFEDVVPTPRSPEAIKAVRGRLGEIFEDLSRGQHFNRYIDLDVERGAGVGRNLAASASAKRVLHFKDADSFFEYNKRYGNGNLTQAVMTGLNRAAENIALMETFGPTPEITYKALKDRIKAQAKRGFDLKDMDTGRQKVLEDLFEKDVKAWGDESRKTRAEVEADAEKTDQFTTRRKLENMHEYILDAFFAEVSGATRVPVSRAAAKWMAGIRAWNVLTKLGGAAISAIADTPIIARETVRQGGTWLEGFGQAAENLYRKFTRPEDQQEFLRTLGIGIEGMRNDMLSRLTAVDSSTPMRLRSLQNKLFRYTGMETWNDAHKSGIAFVVSNKLANMSDKTWGELIGRDAKMKSLLNMYGIDEGKWDMVRKAVMPTSDGKRFMDPSMIRKRDVITDAEIMSYLGITPSKDKAVDIVRRITEFRDSLELDMRTFIADRVDFAVITPTGREAAMMNLGLAPGTPEGEAMRFFAQFKSFPLTVWNKLIRGDFKREGISGFHHTMALMLGMSAFGYLAMSIKDWARGKNRRPIFNDDGSVNGKNVFSALLQGGGLGIFGDLMFGPETRYGHSAFEEMLGPTASAFSDLANIYSSFKSGKDTSSQISNFVRNHGLPFANVWWARSMLDYGLWYSFQEMNNPGYTRRMKRRVEREQNQTFWLSPTTERLRPFE